MASLYDANLWVALTFSAHSHHAAARAEFTAAATGQAVIFCRATQQSFLRLATTPALLKAYRAEGFTNRAALEVYSALTRLPQIRMMKEPPELEPAWHRLAGLKSASPKVWMDAYLAAFAIGHDVELVTFDRDFRSFEKDGLKLRLLAG